MNKRNCHRSQKSLSQFLNISSVYYCGALEWVKFKTCLMHTCKLQRRISVEFHLRSLQDLHIPQISLSRNRAPRVLDFCLLGVGTAVSVSDSVLSEQY